MRENIDEYFLRIVEVVGSRGTCDRGKSGCIIVKEKNILSTGYVGAPHSLPHCDDAGHYIVDNHCLRSTHAEQNAIINSAKNGVKIDGATLYCTMYPCFSCCKMIINAGIKRVVAQNDYHASEDSKRYFFVGGVDVTLINGEVKKY
jgi:dCMP deaminase